jgi:hypothetical protein
MEYLVFVTREDVDRGFVETVKLVDMEDIYPDWSKLFKDEQSEREKKEKEMEKEKEKAVATSVERTAIPTVNNSKAKDRKEDSALDLSPQPPPASESSPPLFNTIGTQDMTIPEITFTPASPVLPPSSPNSSSSVPEITFTPASPVLPPSSPDMSSEGVSVPEITFTPASPVLVPVEDENGRKEGDDVMVPEIKVTPATPIPSSPVLHPVGDDLGSKQERAVSPLLTPSPAIPTIPPTILVTDYDEEVERSNRHEETEKRKKDVKQRSASPPPLVLPEIMVTPASDDEDENQQEYEAMTISELARTKLPSRNFDVKRFSDVGYVLPMTKSMEVDHQLVD